MRKKINRRGTVPELPFALCGGSEMELAGKARERIITVRRVRRILSFTESSVSLQTGDGTLSIRGSGLRCGMLSGGAIRICGRIIGVELGGEAHP